jgi:drug/metabolite transporter (DMT)-like permease
MARLPETALLTSLALVAFASNSILTRLALGGGRMDAATFTSIRLAAGACMLVALVRARGQRAAPARGRRSLAGPLALFVYALPFSFAYVRIGAAAGALLLFGSVQLTMIGWAIASGERPGTRAWIGLCAAVGGLAWLTLPSLGRPDPVGSVLMVVAGCAWGAYSLAGRSATDALASNARSFVWALPPTLLLNLIARGPAPVSARGVLLAAIAGAITSGVGYAIWYRALRGLTALQAAVLQLSVPVIAAAGAVALLHETVNPRLAASGVAVLGGVGLVLSERARRRTRPA